MHCSCTEFSYYFQIPSLASISIYTLCLKKRPTFDLLYNLDIHDPVMIIFGRSVTKEVRNQTMPCFAQTNKQTYRETLRKSWSLGREPITAAASTGGFDWGRSSFNTNNAENIYLHWKFGYTATINTPSCFLRRALYDMISNDKVKNLGCYFSQFWRDSANSASSGCKWLRLAEQVIASRPHASSVQVTIICSQTTTHTRAKTLTLTTIKTLGF